MKIPTRRQRPYEGDDGAGCREHVALLSTDDSNDSKKRSTAGA